MKIKSNPELFLTNEVSSKILDNYWKWFHGFKKPIKFDPSTECLVNKEYFCNKSASFNLNAVLDCTALIQIIPCGSFSKYLTKTLIK